MIVTTSSLYKLAYSKYAIGAYNINNLEQILGLFKGCTDSKAPFIIQLSKGARRYADKRMLEAMIRTAEQFDFRPPGKIFVDEYAKFIAHKNEKLGSAGKLPSVREALSAKS
jgi:fructose/tagatose bisphosphate aldolase